MKKLYFLFVVIVLISCSKDKETNTLENITVPSVSTPNDVSFGVETPITVNINYETMLKVDEMMPVQTTTDLIYQSKLLPKFPLNLDVPVKLDIPFQLKRSYTIPVKIVFNGPAYFAFDESVNLPIKHEFKTNFYRLCCTNLSVKGFSAI